MQAKLSLVAILFVFSSNVFGTGLERGVYRLRNYATNEYMYADIDYYEFDDKRRSVHCWKKTGDPERERSLGTSADWNVIPIGSAFTVQSDPYKGEYLYASPDDLAYDRERRMVFTWRGVVAAGTKDSVRWKFNLKPEICNSCYQVVSVDKNEFLYVASEAYDYDKQRARVFTWRPKTDDYTKRSIWKVIPVE